MWWKSFVTSSIIISSLPFAPVIDVLLISFEGDNEYAIDFEQYFPMTREICFQMLSERDMQSSPHRKPKSRPSWSLSGWICLGSEQSGRGGSVSVCWGPICWAWITAKSESEECERWISLIEKAQQRQHIKFPLGRLVKQGSRSTASEWSRYLFYRNLRSARKIKSKSLGVIEMVVNAAFLVPLNV